eukprot:7353196-Prymnesium_polylepis.1
MVGPGLEFAEYGGSNLILHLVAEQAEVERRYAGDDGEVEALRALARSSAKRPTGVALLEPPVAERHKKEPKVVAQRQRDAPQLRCRPEGLGRQVLPPLQPPAALVQSHEPPAPERCDGAAGDRVEQRTELKVELGTRCLELRERLFALRRRREA